MPDFPASDDSAPMRASILRALRAGASFSTVHKEGGWTIRAEDGAFVYAEFGESDTRRRFTDDAELLACVWRCYRHEVAREAGSTALSDAETWRLIQRRLAGPGAGLAGRLRAAPTRRGHVLLAAVLAVLVAGPIGYLKFHRAAPAAQPAPLAVVTAPPVVSR